MEELLTTKLSLGAEKPFRLLHISDTHLCLADERDNERKNNLAEGRKKVFGDRTENVSYIKVRMVKNRKYFKQFGTVFLIGKVFQRNNFPLRPSFICSLSQA